jgi:cytoskeletal protein RodZ
MSKVKLGEWMWRFLAAVLLLAVGWMAWVIYQLNPPPLVMNAAFEAAAKAKVKDKPSEKQNSQGVITSPAGADESPKAADAAPAAATPPAPEAPKEPPINPEKLKFSDTIALPVPNAKK